MRLPEMVLETADPAPRPMQIRSISAASVIVFHG
jgi:hypothetical protein